MVFAVSPESVAVTATVLLPDPGDGLHGVLVPYEAVGPYSSLHSLTSAPLGLTSAFSVATVCETPEAGPVVTVGGLGSVLKVVSFPLLVPPRWSL